MGWQIKQGVLVFKDMTKDAMIFIWV